MGGSIGLRQRFWGVGVGCTIAGPRNRAPTSAQYRFEILISATALRGLPILVQCITLLIKINSNCPIALYA
jgi:hypothetical protein